MITAIERQSAHHPRLLSTVAGFCLFTALSLGKPLLAQDGAEVMFDREQALVTVHAHGDPLDEILYALGEATGMGVIIYGEHNTPVTVNLEKVPIKTALTRLLDNHSYTIKQDPETHLPVKLWVMPEADLQAIENARVRSKPPPEAEDVKSLAREVRAELQNRGKGESEREILKNLGLDDEEQEELLRMLEEMEETGQTNTP